MRILPLSLCVMLLAGCTTATGPPLTGEEIKQVEEDLTKRAIDYKVALARRINAIGLQLLKHIPDLDKGIASRPYLGISILPRTRNINLYYGQENKRGVFAALVHDASPAQKAGIREGDLILRINDEGIRRPSQFLRRIKDLDPDGNAQIQLLRQGQEMNISVKTGRLPMDLRFGLWGSESVNAMVFLKKIIVSNGLIRFVKSDDELAYVLAHEISHILAKHIKKKTGLYLIKEIISIGAGVAVEIAARGAGVFVRRALSGITSIVDSRYSRDMEREADYLSLKILRDAGYDPNAAVTFHERISIEIPKTLSSHYLSTHPSSPERKLRMEKAVANL